MNSNLTALIPAIITILLAITTRQVVIALTMGIMTGSFLLSQNLFEGIEKAGYYFIHPALDENNVYIMAFFLIFGALAELIEFSGGINGFINKTKNLITSEKKALLTIWAMTPLTFMDCDFHNLATGLVAEPMIKRTDGNREKLAFTLTVSTSLMIVMIPFGTTYVGYILGLTKKAIEFTCIKESPYELFLKSIPFNFYSISMILINFLVIFFNVGFGRLRFPMGKIKSNTFICTALEKINMVKKSQYKPKAMNLVLPLAVFIISIIIFLWWTCSKTYPGFFEALINARFQKSLFYGSILTLLFTGTLYFLQGIPLAELEKHFIKGCSNNLPPLILLLLSWSLADLCQDLGLSGLIADTLSNKLPVFLIPAFIYILSCTISYLIGSSWATWGLIMPLALPAAFAAGASPVITMAATLAGGSFGDSASPLGETPAQSAILSKIPLMNHITTILPFALTGVFISSFCFIVAGILY